MEFNIGDVVESKRLEDFPFEEFQYRVLAKGANLLAGVFFYTVEVCKTSDEAVEPFGRIYSGQRLDNWVLVEKKRHPLTKIFE